MLALLALCISMVSQSHACQEVIAGWDESYCPENITRIEYQVEMDEKVLEGNTVAQVDAFLAWMITNLQDDQYLNYFRLRTEKIKKYYRTSKGLTINKALAGTTGTIDPPAASLMKYRRSFGNFEENGSDLKYQNDLTWEIPMSPKPSTRPQATVDYAAISVLPQWEDILSTKLEANMYTDTCVEDYFATVNPVYGEGSTQFNAKIEFDDDDAYGTNDTNGITMVDTSTWTGVTDGDGTFTCDCAVSNCICCDMEAFYVDYCSYYDDDPSIVTKSFQSGTASLQYILDIDFYWHADGNMTSEETSKGKFTFQVQYNSQADLDSDTPADSSTEVSMKLYKSKTLDGEWANMIAFAETLIDGLTSSSSSSSAWIDTSMCTSDTMCCSQVSSGPVWAINCPLQMTENDCQDVGDGCSWVECASLGECEWGGVGPSRLSRRCAAIDDQADCESSFSGRCNWVTSSAQSSVMGVVKPVGEVAGDLHKVYAGVVIILMICGSLIYALRKKEKTDKKSGYQSTDCTPLLKEIAV